MNERFSPFIEKKKNYARFCNSPSFWPWFDCFYVFFFPAMFFSQFIPFLYPRGKNEKRLIGNKKKVCRGKILENSLKPQKFVIKFSMFNWGNTRVVKKRVMESRRMRKMRERGKGYWKWNQIARKQDFNWVL